MDRLIKIILLVISILILIYFPWNSSKLDNNSNIIKNKESDIFEKFEPANFDNMVNSPLSAEKENKPNKPVIFEKNIDIPKLLQKNVEKNVKTAKSKEVITPPLLNKILNNEDDTLYSVFDKNYTSDLTGNSNIDSVFNSNIIKNDKTPSDVVDTNKNNKKYNAKDFLPKEINDEWFDTDFSQAKHDINDNKLINTDKYIIGVNTVGQSLKNASYDIRGTVPNPKTSVSPWNNSTYEPDYNIKPLC